MNWEYLGEFLYRPKRPTHTTASLKFVDEMNSFGAKGWELVSLTESEIDSVYSCYCVFKRPSVEF